MANDDILAKPPTREELGDDRNALTRWLRPRSASSSAEDPASPVVLGSDGWMPIKEGPPDPDAQAQFQAAEAQFREGKLPEAERAFARLAKRKRGSNWGEKAQFYLAETQFQRGRLVAAHDSYEKLFADYPATQFLEKAVEREYDIGVAWLASSDPRAAREKRPSLGGWFKGRHPAVDVSGHALAVLEHVRHHDPTGPLADDAVVQIAAFHHTNQNFEDASMYYDQLITENPKSPFVPSAMQASIDAKLKDYMGPEYDGDGLERARNLAQQADSLYPERRASYSEEIDESLKTIDLEMAERAYRVGEHYVWTGQVGAAEYCFGEIPVRWPKSPYALRAKEQLARLAKMPRKEVKPSTIFTLPGAPDPSSMSPGAAMPGGGGGMGMGGMGGMSPGAGP
jgi:outer membrane protein assembly factor BamD (BamD/ComL family)